METVRVLPSSVILTSLLPRVISKMDPVPVGQNRSGIGLIVHLGAHGLEHGAEGQEGAAGELASGFRIGKGDGLLAVQLDGDALLRRLSGRGRDAEARPSEPGPRLPRGEHVCTER